MPFLFKKERKIRRSGEYRAIYEQGEKRVGRYVILFMLPAGPAEGRVGITVSRKVGTACERNRAKRRIREVLMQELDGPELHKDIVIVAKSRIKQARFEDLRGDIKRLLKDRGDEIGRPGSFKNI